MPKQKGTQSSNESNYTSVLQSINPEINNMQTSSARNLMTNIDKKDFEKPNLWGSVCFRYKKLQKMYETGEGSHKYPEAVVENFYEKMQLLEMVSNKSDLYKIKQLGFHKLKEGKLKGKYAVWLTGNWRLIVAIEEDKVSTYLLIIEIIDYHH